MLTDFAKLGLSDSFATPFREGAAGRYGSPTDQSSVRPARQERRWHRQHSRVHYFRAERWVIIARVACFAASGVFSVVHRVLLTSNPPHGRLSQRVVQIRSWPPSLAYRRTSSRRMARGKLTRTCVSLC